MFPNDALSVNGNFDQKLFWTPNIWQAWHKPEGCAIVFMFCMGAGAGGGNGTSSSSTAGGSGGSGACSKLTIPAFMLPDTLYIYVGQGGAAQTNGAISYISNTAYSPGSTPAANTCYLASGHTAATASTGGGAGAAEVIATVAADCILANGGISNFIAGHAGNNAQAGGSALSGVVTAYGGGGAANTTTGAQVAGAGLLPTILGGSGTTGTKGNMGITLMGSITGFMPTAGSGGGGNSSTGTGGNGGNGGIGSSGGGGGTGTTATGGTGGTGGNGFIGIWSK